MNMFIIYEWDREPRLAGRASSWLPGAKKIVHLVEAGNLFWWQNSVPEPWHNIKLSKTNENDWKPIGTQVESQHLGDDADDMV